MKHNVGRTIAKACKTRDVARAKRILEGLARQLEDDYPSAAESLREGLDETLTVLRFDLGEWLTKTLVTTNPLEFINGRLRETTANVDRWRDGKMVCRWIAIGLRRSGSCAGTSRCRSSSPPSGLMTRPSTRQPLTRRGRRPRSSLFVATRIPTSFGTPPSPPVHRATERLLFT